jgi:ssDNA-binding replication factor A large subunit
MNNNKFEVKKLSEEVEVKFMKVGELTPNIRDVNLVAKVLELGEVRTVTSRNSGEEHQVMDVLIGDDSGVVYFSAWNEQIEKMKNEETYQFRSAKTILFKRNIRLSLGRQGFIEDSEEKVESVEESNNVSTEEHDIPRRWNRSYGGNRGYDS